MKLRMPKIAEYYTTGENRDTVHKYVNVSKEIDILETIMDDNKEMYNYRLCKNSPDIEVRHTQY